MKRPYLILIPVPVNFSFQECIWFLNRNYDDCLHQVNSKGIRKAVEVGGEMVLFGITEKGNFLEVEVLSGQQSEEISTFLIDYIVDWFDMERDLDSFYQLLRNDRHLNYMIDEFKGLRLIGITDLYEAICWSIIGQQINLTFAHKLKRRLVEKFGSNIEFENEVYHIFPKSEVLAEATVEELRDMQFSQKKAEYLIGIANAFKNGDLSKEIIAGLPDFTTRQITLMAYKGIGLWTANYALMKSLRESAGIPHGDVGLFNALSKHSIITDRGETAKIDQFFEQYAGWEGYIVFYLWRSLAVR